MLLSFPGALSTLLRPQGATEGSIPNKEGRPPEGSIPAVKRGKLEQLVFPSLGTEESIPNKGGKLEQLALGSGAKAARAGTSSVAVND